MMALVWMCLIGGIMNMSAQKKDVKLKFVETSDIHGNFYPYNFKTDKPFGGSLARVQSYLSEQKRMFGDRLVYLDNGDILQGQPTVYYYNFVDTTEIHLAANMLNYMECAAANVGNHDIEAGHSNYDRLVDECKYPLLGANVVDVKTGEPYFKPYQMIEKEGVRVAVLGLITPLVPTWLPETLWSGLRFDDMIVSAQKWLRIIKEKEHPDVIIGLFHSGLKSFPNGNPSENPSLEIALRVPGFDVIFIGHDHKEHCKEYVNDFGEKVWVVNPASNGNFVGDVDVTLQLQDGRVVGKQIEGRLVDMNKYQPDSQFMAHFQPQFNKIHTYVSRKIGSLGTSLSTSDAYFGPSAFIDMINRLQLLLSDADISFCAPLSFNAVIPNELHVRDMFNLYPYENTLYIIRMTGEEIKNYMEMSYSLWTNQMHSPEDHIMLIDSLENGQYKFKNPTFNFDVAFGIRYTVDVTKPQGQKINISSFGEDKPFDLKKEYKVALSSYRANGGGDLLTKGAGIPKDEIPNRVIRSTEKDLRYYITDFLEKSKNFNPQPANHWNFIPEEWVTPAVERDRKLLFK